MGLPLSFPGGSLVKNLPANAGDVGLIPGLRRCPGGGNGNPLQYSCLGSAMDRGAWRATVRGVVKESDTAEHTAQVRVNSLLFCPIWRVTFSIFYH